MTYDWADHYDLLFGGLSATGPLNDTWTFANGTWTNITSTAGAAPPPQTGMVMTYDAADGYVLAWGCPGPNPDGADMCNDTWSFSHGKWREITATLDVPSGQVVGVTSGPGPSNMVYDAADSYVLLLAGGSTVKYSAGVWTLFCGSPTNCSSSLPGPGNMAGSAVYDANDGYVLFVGGAGSYTWKFSAGTWTNITLTVGTPPPSWFDSLMGYDNSTGSVVLFGGLAGARPQNDTWVFHGGVWENVSSSPSPPAGFQAAAAYDPTDAGVLVFGGIGSSPSLTWMWGSDPPIAGLAIAAVPLTPTPGSPISFSAAFRGGVGGFTYSWQFGDGSTSTAAAPSHAYSVEGYYVTRLWLNDSSGHSANASFPIHVYIPLAIVSIDATPNPAALGQPVNFSAIVSGGTPPYSYSWAFGDGGIGGNLSNITHIYTTNGPFEAVVTVTDAAGGVARSDLNVSIRLQALAGFAEPAPNTPLTVSFFGQAQGGVPPYRYSWTFGDGTTSTAEDPIHAYNSSGSYTVVLTVVDARENASTTALTVRLGSTVVGDQQPALGEVELIFGASAAVVVAAFGSVAFARRRTQRQEGERWIKELTAETEPPEQGADR